MRKIKSIYSSILLILSGAGCAWFMFQHKSDVIQVLHRNVFAPTRPPENSLAFQGQFSDKRKSAVQLKPFEPLVFPVNRDTSFDFKAAMRQLNEAKVKDDDPKLVQLIRDYYIEFPSKLPYNLTFPDTNDPSRGQAPFVDSRLNFTEGGFYVECGALNGEKGSNTLFFERYRKWNGLLVEADPTNYEILKTKNRKAFTINSCLNTEKVPAMMKFNKAVNRGRVVHNKEAENWIRSQRISKNEVEVQCFPLYSILLALNQLTVDFFSLDIEGDELYVLKTIPWDKVDIKMLTVEVAHGNKNTIKSYMEGIGYDAMLYEYRWGGGVDDIIFRKKSLRTEYF